MIRGLHDGPTYADLFIKLAVIDGILLQARLDIYSALTYPSEGPTRV